MGEIESRDLYEAHTLCYAHIRLYSVRTTQQYIAYYLGLPVNPYISSWELPPSKR